MWLLDVGASTISVYRDPGPSGYGAITVARQGDLLRPAGSLEAAIAASDLLG